jgi:hypothetical protein
MKVRDLITPYVVHAVPESMNGILKAWCLEEQRIIREAQSERIMAVNL